MGLTQTSGNGIYFSFYHTSYNTRGQREVEKNDYLLNFNIQLSPKDHKKVESFLFSLVMYIRQRQLLAIPSVGIKETFILLFFFINRLSFFKETAFLVLYHSLSSVVAILSVSQLPYSDFSTAFLIQFVITMQQSVTSTLGWFRILQSNYSEISS